MATQSITSDRPFGEGHLDFAEIDSEQLEALVRDLLENAGLTVEGLSRGADDGCDLLATEVLLGKLSVTRIRWLVQCKHYSKSNKSVTPNDLGSITDRCLQHGATKYLLVCTTLPSSGLERLQQDLNSSPDGPNLEIWDRHRLESKLLEPDNMHLARRFFPRSFRCAIVPQPVAQHQQVRKPADLDRIDSALERFYGLKSVVVCETPEDDAQLYQALGAAAARYFERRIADHSVVGVSCGRTIYSIATALPSIRRSVAIYPISFNVGDSLSGVMSSYATVFAMSSRIESAVGYEIPLPAFLVDPDQEWPILRRRGDIRRYFERLRGLTAAFFSAGHLAAGSSCDWGTEAIQRLLPQFSLDSLLASGACGEINWHPYRTDGSIVDADVARNSTSMGPAKLRELAADPHRHVVLVAGGRAKYDAILGALRGRFLNVLVTDHATAVALMDAP